MSAHKMYGPKGVGALYVRRRKPRVRLVASIDGGGHERGMRSGTLNVTGIVGMGKAAEILIEEIDKDVEHVTASCATASRSSSSPSSITSTSTATRTRACPTRRTSPSPTSKASRC
jgi:cysteine sulfinate desulfinase/cysteine desulfurase-like protein